MSDRVSITVESLEAQQAFENLKPKNLAQATRTAFRKAGNKLKKGVQQAYQAQFPGSILYKDVHMAAFRGGDGVVVDLVHTKRRAKGDPLYKAYIMRILEVGNYKTQPRSTKAGYNRGNIVPRPFFNAGIGSASAAAQAGLQQDIEAAIIKKWNKISGI